MSAGQNGAAARPDSGWAVFLVFLGLGLTSFGGPVAHLGYFHNAFVVRRRWLTAADYADLVALCQFLPGPSSSQVGFGIGLSRAGLAGAFAAWAGFTLPSALLLGAFGYGVLAYGDVLPTAALHGLKLAAVAVVAQAVWTMAQSLAPDRARRTLAVVAAVAVLFVPGPAMQAGVIVLSGVAGFLWLSPPAVAERSTLGVRIDRRLAVGSLMAFALLLIALPLLSGLLSQHWLALIDAFYRSGALVFGGGHVMLPLLQSEVVATGWVSSDAFLAGYGAAQAVPGPLFTFSAYLGVVMAPSPNGWAGALLCLIAVFLPSFLLLLGVLPFWDTLRGKAWVRRALVGVNAGVVGLLLAALHDPVWTSSVRSAGDVALVLLAMLLLMGWRVPPWLVVLLCMAGGWAVAALA